jgi:dephospho-CoA kinase
MKRRIVVGVTGMPGAGKSTFNEVAQKIGFRVVVMGDEIREEAKLRRLEPTPENIGGVMIKLRREEGPSVVARRCVQKIKRLKENRVIVDGVRSLHELEEFKKSFPKFSLMAIHSSPKTRFRRLKQRKRSDDPKSWEEFIKRDVQELGVGLGDVIATADHVIINEGTKAQLNRKIRKTLGELSRNWTK